MGGLNLQRLFFGIFVKERVGEEFPNCLSRLRFHGDCRRGDHGSVQLREVNRKLRKHAVGAVRGNLRGVHPEAIAVTAVAVGVFTRHTNVTDLIFGRFLRPGFRNHAPAAVFALVEITIGEFRQILGGDIKPPAAGFDPVLVGFPKRRFNPERLEQPRCQIVNHAHFGHAVQNRAEHIDIFIDIKIFRAGFKHPRRIDEIFNPVDFAFVRHHIRLFAGGHGQKRAHRHFLEIFMRRARRVIREKVGHDVIQRQKPFRNRKPHRGCRKAFADRIHRVLGVRVKRFIVPFGGDFAVAQYHQAVELQLFLLDIVDKLLDNVCINADVFRRCRTR